MAINRVNGEMLQANLLRAGVDLAFETDLLYLDVANGRIGIKNNLPTADLHVTGTTLINGQLTVDNLVADGATLSATAGDLALDSATGDIVLSASGNISANNNRITNCADPVGSLDVVNLQTLNSSIGSVATDKIVADDTNVTIVDDGVSAGSINFVIDGSQYGYWDATIFQVSSDMNVIATLSANDAELGNLNIVTDTITSDSGNIYLSGNINISGTGTQRIIYTNASGVIDSKPALAFNGTTDTLTLTGILAVDSLTLDGTGITSSTSLDLNTTSDNDLTISTGAGEVTMSGTSALNLPSGTTTNRPGSPATGAFRWNTTTGFPEFYDGSTWYSVARSFNVTSQQIIPNGVDTSFTLNKAATTPGILVTINGVVQDPDGGVYSVSGTTITFTSVLSSTDVVSIRFLEI